MSLGERGGTTATLEAGVGLIETHKPDWAAAVRADILRHLQHHPTWHRDNLDVPLPADSKNVLGAVVAGLIRAGRIEETGERRASAEPAAHGRRSAVYRLATQVSGVSPPSPSPGKGGAGPGRSHTAVPATPPTDDEFETPTLFTVEPVPTGPGHIDLDQRKAA